jgi:RND family efflux transporter MFP subunit
MTLTIRPDRRTVAPPKYQRLVLGRVALTVLAVLLSSCSQQTAEEVESETVVPVTTAAVTTGSIRGLVRATGIVSPAPDAELIVTAPETARIQEIPHAEGERVARGDVVVQFEIPTLVADVQRQTAEVQRAQAQLANAKASQTRAHELFDRGVGARKDAEEADRAIADAEAAVAQAEASRAAAAAAAARQVVRAAFDGVVAKRFHNPGDFVEPSAADPVLRIVDPRRLEVVASVPIGDAPRLVVGAAARIVPAPAGGGAVALRVITRPTQVEAGTATVPVRLAFATPTTFPVGTPVQLDIDAERHTGVVLIPAVALVREGEETAVFVAAGGKAERRAVEIGLADGMHVEIVSGVKAGEMVIVDGQAGLPDGTTITQESGERADDKTPAGAAADKDEQK